MSMGDPLKAATAAAAAAATLPRPAQGRGGQVGAKGAYAPSAAAAAHPFSCRERVWTISKGLRVKPFQGYTRGRGILWRRGCSSSPSGCRKNAPNVLHA